MVIDNSEHDLPSRRDFLKAGGSGGLMIALAGCGSRTDDGDNTTGTGSDDGDSGPAGDGSGGDDYPLVARPAGVDPEFALDADDLVRGTFQDERYTRIEGDIPGFETPEGVTPVGHAVTYGHDMQLPSEEDVEPPTLNALSAGVLSYPVPTADDFPANPYAERPLSELVSAGEDNLLLAAAGLGPSVEWLADPQSIERTDVEFIEGTMTVETFVGPVSAALGPGLPDPGIAAVSSDAAVEPGAGMLTLHTARGFVGGDVIIMAMINGWERPPTMDPPPTEIGPEMAELLANIYEEFIKSVPFLKALDEIVMRRCDPDETGPPPDDVERTVEYSDYYGLAPDAQVELGYPDQYQNFQTMHESTLVGRTAPGPYTDCEEYDPEVHNPGEWVHLGIEERVSAYRLGADGAIPFAVKASPRVELEGEEQNPLVNRSLSTLSSAFGVTWDLLDQVVTWRDLDWGFKTDPTVLDDYSNLEMLGQTAEAKGFKRTIEHAEKDGNGTVEDDVYVYLARITTADEAIVAGALSVDTGTEGFFDDHEATKRLFENAVQRVVPGPEQQTEWVDGSVGFDLVQICRNTRLETGNGDVLEQPNPQLVKGRNTAAPFDVSIFSGTPLSSHQLEYGVFQYNVAFRSGPPLETILPPGDLDDLDGNSMDPDVLFDRNTRDSDPANDLPVFELTGSEDSLSPTVSLEFRAPSGYPHDQSIMKEGRDYDMTGLDVLRVGVTFVTDPGGGENYGNDNGQPSQYVASVESIFEYLKRTFPTGIALFRASRGIGGATNKLDVVANRKEWIDYREARATLEKDANPSNNNHSYRGDTFTHKISESDATRAIRNNGFDVWLLIVPDGYYEYHRDDINPDGLAPDSDRLAVTTVDGPGQDNGLEDCGEVAAQEIGHQLTADPYKNPQRGAGMDNPLAQRDSDGTEVDNRDFDHARHLSSENSKTPNDDPGLVSRAYSLAEGEFVVPSTFEWDGGLSVTGISDEPQLTDDNGNIVSYGPTSSSDRIGRVESYMSYSSRYVWADSLLTQDVLNSDLNRDPENFRTLKLGGLTDVGTFLSDGSDDDGTGDQEQPTVRSVRVFEDFVSEPDEQRLAEAEQIVEVSVLGPDGTVVAETAVPGVLTVDGHEVDENRLDGTPFDVELPPEAFEVVVETDDADLQFNPITRPIRDAYGRLPERGRGTGFDREELLDLLAGVDAEMDAKNFTGARNLLVTYADEQLSATIDPEFEPLANQPNEPRLRSLFEEMIERLDGLADEQDGSKRLECGADIPADITEDTVLQEDCGYTVPEKTQVKEGATLHIEPGVTIEVGQNVTMEVNDGGLSAQGTADKPIRIRGSTPAAGFWDGIRILTNHPANELSHVICTHAGGGYFGSAIEVEGTATITDCTVAESSTAGIKVHGGSSLPEFGDNHIQSVGGVPLHLHSNLVRSLDGTTTFEDNDDSYILIGLAGGTQPPEEVTEDGAWRAMGIPYRIRKGFDVKSRIQIEPGAHLQFERGTALIVVEGGQLVADASDGEPITFEGVVDSAGYWRGIHFGSLRANLLRNVVVSHAGGDYRSANVGVGTEGEAEVVLQDSRITDSATWGVRVAEGSTLSAENNTYENNADGDVQRMDA